MSVNESILEMERFVQDQVSDLNWIHTRGMIPIGRELAREMKANEVVVSCAILFHDVAKDQNPTDHAYFSARVCEEFLRKRDFLPEFISQVVHCVETHSWAWGEESGPPETDEARIVFDADMIQQLGQVGVLKHLAFKYGNLPSLYERIEKTREDLEKAASIVLTPAGKKMAANRNKVNHILSDILEGK